MLKLALVGVWMALVTASAAYFSAGLMSPSAGGAGGEQTNLGLEDIATNMTSIPMVHGGAIVGYVIIQLNFEADKAKREEFKLDPKPFLVDAAFRMAYSSSQ